MPDKFPSVMIDAYVVMPNHFHGIVVIIDSDVSDANIVDIGAGGHAGPPLHIDFDDSAADHGLIGASDDFTADHGAIGAGGHAGPPLHDDFTADHGAIGAGGHAGPPLHDVSDVQRDEIDDSNVYGVVGPNDTADRDAVGADQRVCPPRNAHESVDSNTAPTLGAIIQWFKTMTTNEYIRSVKQSCWPPFQGKLWQRNYYESIIRDEAQLSSIRHYIANNPIKWELDQENPVNMPKKKRSL